MSVKIDVNTHAHARMYAKKKKQQQPKKKLKSVYTFNLEYKCTWILTIAIHIYKKTRLRDAWEIYDIDFIA